MKVFAELGYYCVALDLPPFGFSFNTSQEQIKYDRLTQAHRIISVLDSLNIQKVTLIGHSFGGKATLTTALLIPSRIERLILIDIALGFGPHENISAPNPAPMWLETLLNNMITRQTLAAVATYPPLTKTFIEMFVANPNSITHEVDEAYQVPLALEGKMRQMGDWLKNFLLTQDNELIQNKDIFRNFVI